MVNGRAFHEHINYITDIVDDAMQDKARTNLYILSDLLESASKKRCVSKTCLKELRDYSHEDEQFFDLANPAITLLETYIVTYQKKNIGSDTR